MPQVIATPCPFGADCSWLAIVQPDGSFEVSRVD